MIYHRDRDWITPGKTLMPLLTVLAGKVNPCNCIYEVGARRMNDKDNAEHRDDAMYRTQSRLWTRDFILLCVGVFAIYTGFQMQMPTLPVYIETRSGSPGWVGLITGLFVFTAVLIRPWLGVQMDRHGRKGIFILGLLIFVLATISYHEVHRLWVLILLRLFHGLGWGAIPAGGGAMATDLIPIKRRGEGMGYYGLATTLAMAMAPALGLWLMGSTHHPHFFFLFMTSATLSLIAMVLISLVRLPAQEITSTRFKELTSAPDGFAPPQPDDSRVTDKDKVHWIEPAALPASWIILLVNVGFGGMTTFVTLWAAQRHIPLIALYFLVFSGAVLIFRPIAGMLFDRKGPELVLVPGLLMLTAGMAVLAVATNLSSLLLAGVLAGIGFGSTQPTLQAIAVQKVSAQRRGAANATFYSAFDLGIGIGSMGLGLLVTPWGYPAVYWASAGISLVALVAFLWNQQHSRVLPDA